MFTASLVLAMLLVVWFETEAFIEYAKLLRIKPLCIVNYLKIKEEDPNLEFLGFLQEYYDNFFVRLITCPICLSIWLGAIVSLCFGILPYFLATSFIGLSFYLGFTKLRKNA